LPTKYGDPTISSQDGLLANVKPIILHSKFTKTVVIFFVAVFTWQSLAKEMFAALVTAHNNKYQIYEKHRIDEQPVSIRPDSAAMYFYQGLRNYDLGHWQEAIFAFKEAIIIKPEYEGAHFGLGIVYSRLELWEEALASFKKAVEINPNYARGHLCLGITYDMIGYNKEAVKSLKKAIQIKPGYALAHYALALSYLMVSDKTSALKEYDILKSVDSKLANQLIRMIETSK